MISDYRIKAGHNEALGGLTVLNPQPRSLGVQATERSYGLSGAVHERGLYIEIVYDYIATPTDYQVLLALMGTNTDLSAPVTLYAWRRDYDYVRYNAIAVRPQIGQDGGWTNYYLRNVVFLFTHLEELDEP